MNHSRWIVSALLAATGALAAAPKARAADPVVLGVSEAESPGTGDRVLVVYGLRMTRIKTWELREEGGTTIAPLPILFKSRNVATLALPTDLADTHTVPGPFALHYTFGRTGLGDVSIGITDGAPAVGSINAAVLDPALRVDLNDADTVGGELPAVLHDWNNLTNVPAAFADGTDDGPSFTAGSGLLLDTTVFSADFTTSGGDAGSDEKVARGNHLHDGRYYTETELNGAGAINNASNPVDWTKLKNVPAAFADGTDDVAVLAAGNGILISAGVVSADFTTSGGDAGMDTKVARGNHVHDGRYYTETELNAAGTINTGSNPVDWTKLKNVPAAFADGTDDVTSLTAGNGILISSNVVSANFAGSGSANTVARGDHTHTGFLATTGGTLSGTLTISASGTAIAATSGNTSSTGGIHCTTSGGIAIFGSGNLGVYGECDSDGGGFAGVQGFSSGNNEFGVLGEARDPSSTAIHAFHYGIYGGVALDAYARGGTAIRARAGYYLYGGDVVSVEGYPYGTGKSNTGVRVQMNGSRNTGIVSYASGYGALGADVGASGNRARGLYVHNYSEYHGRGLEVNSSGYASKGMYLQSYGYNATGLLLNHYGSGDDSDAMLVNIDYAANFAVFRRYGNNYARINSAGKGYFNGGTQSSGADFAESVKVDTSPAEFEPGDVVVIDTNADRRFSMSREASSPLVAGVISTKPALLGTQHDVAAGRNANWRATEVQLGIVGIVPTKVCDEGGAIRRGDLLVTASLPGHARKAPANAAQGTILGKALAPLKQGKGKIEVLLISR